MIGSKKGSYMEVDKQVLQRRGKLSEQTEAEHSTSVMVMFSVDLMLRPCPTYDSIYTNNLYFNNLVLLQITFRFELF